MVMMLLDMSPTRTLGMDLRVAVENITVVKDIASRWMLKWFEDQNSEERLSLN